MQASVKIMDIDVDMMSNDVFIRKMNEYLTDDHLDVIMFASTKMLNKAMEDEEYRTLLDKADLFARGKGIADHASCRRTGSGGYGSQLPQSWYDAGKSHQRGQNALYHCGQ